MFTGFQPAVSPEALMKMSQQVRRWRIHTRTRHDLNELAALINPVVAGSPGVLSPSYDVAPDPFAESFCNTSPWVWCSLSLLP